MAPALRAPRASAEGVRTPNSTSALATASAAEAQIRAPAAA